MRSFLGGVRRRVETLERVILTNCDRSSHTVIRFDGVDDGAALPAWPEADDPAQARCQCGRELTYLRVVWRYLSEAQAS